MLTECFRVLAAVNREFNAWESVSETSRLAEDNAASALYRPMTYELHYLVSNALDHLNLVQSLWNSGKMPPFAPFTLIRAAIESCAYGIWIQKGGTVDARLIRLLEMQWDQRRNIDTYTASAGAHTPSITKWLEEVLNDTKNRRSRLKQRKINQLPSITDILIDTDRFVATKKGLNGLSAWRIGSGVTHGNQQFAKGLMDERAITLVDGSTGSEHSISTIRFAMVLMPAANYLSKLMRMILDKSEAQPGRPSPEAITGGPLPPNIG